MRSRIGFKVMPLADAINTNLFYADLIGVNTSTASRGTRDLAVKLANVMAASDTVVASIGPDSANPYPQYLMATRPPRCPRFTTPCHSAPTRARFRPIVVG